MEWSNWEFVKWTDGILEYEIMIKEIKGQLKESKANYAIVVSRINECITNKCIIVPK